MTTLQLWPLGDGVNASSVWNPDTAGNGGFQGGGSVATVMGATSAAVTTKDETGATINTNENLLLITSLGLADSLNAVTNGGKALAYNGVGITPASPLSAADKAKITGGQYTLWAYQHFMWKGALDANQLAFKNTLLANIGANIGSSGIPIADMQVARGDDGGLVGP